MGFHEIRRDVIWIYVAQDRDKCRRFVYTVPKLQVA